MVVPNHQSPQPSQQHCAAMITSRGCLGRIGRPHGVAAGRRLPLAAACCWPPLAPSCRLLLAAACPWLPLAAGRCLPLAAACCWPRLALGYRLLLAAACPQPPPAPGRHLPLAPLADPLADLLTDRWPDRWFSPRLRVPPLRRRWCGHLARVRREFAPADA